MLIASSLLLFAVILPVLMAYWLTPPDMKFMGFLVNPLDEASYLAKMHQGYDGSWVSYLRLTPEIHRGVFIYAFYLALGHLARLLGLPLILAFDAARLLCGLLMFASIYRLAASLLGDAGQRRLAWGLAVVGGGLGWLALILGQWDPVPPDILASADAFPLQVTFLYPHMTFAIAIGVWMADTLLRLALDVDARWPGPNLTTAGLVLGAAAVVNMTPYILAPIGFAYLPPLVSAWRRRRSLPWRELAWGAPVLAGGIPMAVYMAWAVSEANPVIHSWVIQNVTLAPPIGRTLMGFGPLAVLAAPGWWLAWRQRDVRGIALSLWVISAFGLAYSPLPVQRRFFIGINVPLALSAAIGLQRVILPALAARWRPALLGAVLCLTSLSTVVALVLPTVGILSPGPLTYIGREEADALDWIEANAPQNSLVLASPPMSLYVATRGMRVVYGHHHETARGTVRLAEVEDFYRGTDCDVIRREGVQYVIAGPYERELAGDASMCAPGGRQVYRSPDGTLAIYALP